MDEEWSTDPEKYDKLLKETKWLLYLGCEDFFVLAIVAELMYKKVECNMTNRNYDMMIRIFKHMLPKPNALSTIILDQIKCWKISCWDMKIHACTNKCVLFYHECEKLDKCPKRNESRYWKNKISSKMCYSPLTPILQKLYILTHTARDMRMHKEEWVNDYVLRHPADGKVWKEFDKIYPDFAAEQKNIKLWIISDDFNPVGNVSHEHNTWPVIILPHNLPPGSAWRSNLLSWIF